MWRRAALCVIFFIPPFPVSAFLAYPSTLPKRSIALLGKTSWAPWVETAAPAPATDTKTFVTAQDADIYEAKFAELKAEGQKRMAEREAIQACYKENIRVSALKAEGEARIADRQAIQAAYDSKVKFNQLKAEGETRIAEKEKIQAAYAYKVLKAEGEARIAERMEIQSAYEAKMKFNQLKAEGEARIAKRIEIQAAYEEAKPKKLKELLMQQIKDSTLKRAFLG